ncbi:MAG: UDP-glucose 4-epimerase GalE, partial [Verrucomicrobiota bacterium]
CSDAYEGCLMRSGWFLQDLMSSIADQGRNWLPSALFGQDEATTGMQSLIEALVRSRGEASGLARTASLWESGATGCIWEDGTWIQGLLLRRRPHLRESSAVGLIRKPIGGVSAEFSLGILQDLAFLRVMRVFVTGGAGYIGSVAVAELIAAGHEVMVYDNLYMGHVDAVDPAAEFIEGDLADRELLGKSLSAFKPEGAMHFASYSLVGESVVDPFKYLGPNYTNALNLIELGIEHGLKRFILSSTAALFDDPQVIPISETEPFNPGNPYGESKYFIERVLHWANITKGLRFAALRYFNAAGCTEQCGEDHRPESHLIPLVIQVALEQREQIKIFGNDYETPDGTCIRDYIHVRDLASAHLLALEALEQNETLHYNLGNGSGFSVQEVVETVRKVTGHPIPAEVVERRAGDPAVLIADSSKIRKELGWEPQYDDITSIVSSAWEWHRRHPNGYDS